MSGLRLFICHDSVDAALCERFERTLAPLQRAGVLSTWHFRSIQPGSIVSQEVEQHFSNAHILVLLISVDLLSSNECWDLHTRAAARNMTVIPILIRSAPWEATPLKQLQLLPRNKLPVSRWQEPDEAWTEIAGEISKRAAVINLSTDASIEQRWRVPQPGHNFTGREVEIRALHEGLCAHRLQVISGLGGTGKTELARAYAQRFKDNYQAGVSLTVGGESGLRASLAGLARQLRLGVDENSDELLPAVLRWLERHDRWLLLLDNVDVFDQIAPLLNPSPRGHLLITTRASSGGDLGAEFFLTLQPLASADAVHFFKKVTGRGPTESTALAELAEELGFMPLALTHAAAHIRAQQVPVMDYLRGFRLRHRARLQARPKLDPYSATVAATWMMNVQQVRQESLAAAALLECCSFLCPDGIPEELFVSGAALLGPELAAALAMADLDPLLLGELLQPLFRYSLIERDPTERTLRIHRLVQSAIQEDLSTESRGRWLERLATVLARLFPSPPTYPTWARCRRLITHVAVCAPLFSELSSELKSAGDLLEMAGQYLLDQAQFTQAERLLHQSSTLFEKLLGPDSAERASILSKLGGLSQSQGHYAEAEAFYDRARVLREQRFGSDHPLVANVLQDQALLISMRGRAAHQEAEQQAEALFARALTILEKALGAEHLEVGECLNRLSVYYLGRGRPREAEPLCRRALLICEAVLGPSDPNIANVLNTLAGILNECRDHVEAEQVHRRALGIREQTLRSDHPRLADSLNNLAVTCLHQGKRAEAEPLFWRALSISEKALGPEHPEVAQSLNNLAVIHLHQHRYADAEPLLERALSISEKVLGPTDRDVARILISLGYLHRQLGNLERAEALLRRALKLQESALGPDHPDLANSMEQLAALYRCRQDSVTAAALFEKAARLRSCAPTSRA